MLSKTELNITSLPPKDICIPFPIESILLILVVSGLQNYFLLGLDPTTTPKNLKGKVTASQDRKLATIEKNSSLRLMPNILVLERFTLRSQTISNPLRIPFKLQRLS